jgi:hypothetical protein
VKGAALRRLAWPVWFVSIAASVAAVALAAANAAAVWWILFNVPGLVGCATVGLVVCLKAPANLIGRLFLAVAAALGWAALCDVYAVYGASFTTAAAVVANTLTAFPLVLIPVLLLVFPDGRLHSPRWRPAAAVWAVGASAVVAGFVLSPGPMGLDADPALTNPIGVSGVVGRVAGIAGLIGIVAVFAVMAIAAGGLVVRFRHAAGTERQQLKWFGSAAAGIGLVAVASPVLWAAPAPWSTYVVDAAWAVAGTTLVVATGIAVLRYRLYDIDVIIRKTIVYTSLVATLACAYLGGIFVLDAALQAVTGASGALAVTLSTLAAAGLFQPLRGRIQRAVDRRFYRRKYDAARTLEGFSGRLRDQIDLDALHRELLAVLGDTVQPSHARLWLQSRDEAGDGRVSPA